MHEEEGKKDKEEEKCIREEGARSRDKERCESFNLPQRRIQNPYFDHE